MQHRPQTYPMPYSTPAPSPKYVASHSTSSAFSASANPNEDWTKISDLAERRRIQNRIAQRNYRKKIKRRLEDLEKRAGSSSASPEQSHAELPTPKMSPRGETGPKRQKSKNESAAKGHRRTPEPLSFQYSLPDDHHSSTSPYDRDISISPPPSYGYSYSLPDPVAHAPYPQHMPFNTLPAPFPDYSSQQQYLPPLPTTLPSMPLYDYSSSKNNGYFDDEPLNQYGASYPPFTSIELPMQQSYPESNIHVNHPEYSFLFQ